jgi:UDP-N-acetylglucosamine acyltransferase
MSQKSEIHPTAIIQPGAELADGVKVGPYCVVGSRVAIGRETRLHSHVVVEGRTTIGESCEIFPFASLGHIPQDKKFHGEDSVLEIGSHNSIRENVTMNPGTDGGGGKTKVGSHGLYMVGAHVAHDCIVGDHVILANNATLGGHCVVEDHAILGGLSAVHQFVRIGRHAFLGGMSGLEHDLIPFGMAVGDRASLQGLNLIGMKRRNFGREQIHALRNAYRLLFSHEGTLMERLADVEALFKDDPEVGHIIAFIRARSDRAICVPRTASAT